MKPRVAYILRQYPMLCETYIQSEIDALRDEFDIHVLTSSTPKDAARYTENPAPYTKFKGDAELLNAVRELKPNLIHAHWMIIARWVQMAAHSARVPYTFRAHSFDTLPAPYMDWWFNKRSTVLRDIGSDDQFLGVLAFPMSRGFLTSAGIPNDRVIDCFPVVDVARFRDRSPNGDGVMNVGACLPKKDLKSYIELGTRVPELSFDLYPVGYDTEEISEDNRKAGGPITIHECLNHSQMPAVFKAHRWLVYTADFELKNVGWPLSVAEAQASGCGVVMANIRPDVADYVGDGGFLFRSLDEVEDIIRGPVPEEVRERGFELAERSDIGVHRKLLSDLWKQALY